jgi:hypothetical protein
MIDSERLLKAKTRTKLRVICACSVKDSQIKFYVTSYYETDRNLLVLDLV